MVAIRRAFRDGEGDGMRTHTRRPWIPLFASLLAAALAAWPAPAQVRTLDGHRDAEREERLRLQRESLLPPAMTPLEIDAIARALRLVGESIESFNALKAHYADRIAPLERTHRREIALRWPACFEYDRVRREVIAVPSPTLVELYEYHFELLDRILEADRALFAGVRALLEDESAVLSLLRLESRRLRDLRDLPGELPEETLDLADLVAEVSLSDEQRATLQPVLRSYDERVITLLRSRSFVSRHRIEEHRVRHEVEFGPDWESDIEHEQLASIRAEFARFALSGFSADGETVSRINRETLEEVESRLPHHDAVRLRAAFHRAVMPEMFEEEDESLDLAARMREFVSKQTDSADSIALLDASVKALMDRVDELGAPLVAARRAAALAGRAAVENAVGDTSFDERRAAITRMRGEIAVIEARLTQREAHRTLTAQILSIVAPFDTAEDQPLVKAIREFRLVQEHRDEADAYRLATLKQACDAAERRQREDERDRESRHSGD